MQLLLLNNSNVFFHRFKNIAGFLIKIAIHFQTPFPSKFWDAPVRSKLL